MTIRRVLEDTAGIAADYLEGISARPVGWSATVDELRASLGGPLPPGPTDPSEVIEHLAAAAEPGLVASPGGRYFGFVIGGALPAALAADWLTSTWDQNSGLFVCGPSAAIVEEVAGAWTVELLGLAEDVSFGFVTGCQMAHVTALAAARHSVFAQVGWDVNERGLIGAPPVHVLVGAERHATVDRALRFLGLGIGCIVPVAGDGQGRMLPGALREALAPLAGPTIVCAQAGNVNTGAIDPLEEIADIAHEAGAWLHIDGAFGLWAAASPALRHLVAGAERADSWATDAHKWLNVPYDCGIALCAHPEAHQAAMSIRAGYLIHADPDGPRDELNWNPDFSRRARGFPVYAAIRSLGRSGVAELVERCCAHAQRFAEVLGASPKAEILNEVVLNQVLVRFLDDGSGGDHDAYTRAVIKAVQDDGTCWLSGTTWHDMAAMRISVSNWSTTGDDVERSLEAILRAAREATPLRAA
ncbi:MAG TPA: aminotransferase class V-fold PLP-dependent enzyme [Solirubrobacteraceae bacterium]|jgi:glutamate/tyrosine decarboxylase-like PLP-dependent enzyme|nr:aminotransferase class V-fold PLP-dependent enzyme [Solirubrobacteraceae bacterium]